MPRSRTAGLFVNACIGAAFVLTMPALIGVQSPVTEEARAQPVSGDDLVRALLISERTHLVVGEENWVGLTLSVSRGWYVYWRNPGGGMATSWELGENGEGLTLGDAVWPQPEMKETFDDQVDYVMDERVFIMIPVYVDPMLADRDAITITLNSSWLVCKDVCIPGSGTVSLTLPVTDDASVAQHDRRARIFERARSESAEIIEDLTEAGIEASVDNNQLVLAYEGASELAFYPFENEAEAYPAQPARQSVVTRDPLGSSKRDGLRLVIDYNDRLSETESIEGILVVKRGDNVDRYQISVPVG